AGDRGSREWRNRQTRWLQVPVPERAWGFNSPLAHTTQMAPTRDTRAGPYLFPTRRWLPVSAAHRLPQLGGGSEVPFAGTGDVRGEPGLELGVQDVLHVLRRRRLRQSRRDRAC